MRPIDQIFQDEEKKEINSPAHALTKQLGDLMAKQNFFASQENQFMVDSLEERMEKVRAQLAAYEKEQEEKRKQRKDDE